MRKYKFKRKKSLLKLIVTYLILVLACVISLYPIINVLTIALRPGDVSFSSSLSIIPSNATLDNFKTAFLQYGLAGWILNSLLIASLATVFGVLLSNVLGYVLSRFKFRGKKLTMISLIVTQMLPVTMTLLPLFLIFARLHIDNYFIRLTIVYIFISMPFNVWIVKGYFDTIPYSLEESAYVDGAGVVYTFYKIILPLATPAIALAALFSFMGAWSEYVIASAMLSDYSNMTLPIGLTSMQGDFSTAWGPYSASAIITAVPVMILFIALSKYLISGLTLGSVKG